MPNSTSFLVLLLTLICWYPSTFAHEGDEAWDDPELFGPLIVFACTPASSAQKAQVERGNELKEHFLDYCRSATAGSPWCEQLVRPNPSSLATFRCTYGPSMPHQLIHPDTSTWPHAVAAVQLVQHLQGKGIDASLIYNWWRPEPYNQNVGGAPGRHPEGTSVDVRFATKSDQERAFLELCRARKAGRLRALGYYPSSALHVGVGDRNANTWGKSCP